MGNFFHDKLLILHIVNVITKLCRSADLSGSLPCCLADPGTGKTPEGNWLEVLSMSGLQVDFYNDYIGGEVRLACYHTGGKEIPVTGISISGKLSQVLGSIRLSPEVTTHNGYHGPERAILSDMKIF